MQRVNSVLILNGSPQKAKSSSQIIAEYLKNEFEERQIDTELVIISSILKKEAGRQELVSKVNSCDVLFLIFPLYIDSLPYNLIEALEMVKKYHSEINSTNNEKKVVAISHSGLEANHNRVAVQICECFAKELNYQFAGGLMLGNSALINGSALPEFERMTKYLQNALKLTVNAIAVGDVVPLKAKQLISKPMLPGPLWLFKILGNWVMNQCFQKKSFDKGMGKLHRYIKPFFS